MQTVFISHSADGDPFAGAVLDRLRSLLETKHYQIFVSEPSLSPGDDWEHHLERGLDSCDAAVVLLNGKALQSEWVRYEVSVLVHRKHMYKQRRKAELFVLPVLLGGVRSQDVKNAGLKRLAKRIQLMDRSTEMDAFTLAEEISRYFTSTAINDANGEAMAGWIQRIAYQIAQVGLEGQLVAAARALEIDEDEAENARLWNGSQFLAERLIKSRLCRHTIDAVAKLTPFMSQDQRRTLVDEIRPTWVDGDAAELILSSSPSDRLVALLNATWQHTGVEYFARATCHTRSGYWSDVVGVVPGAQPADELLAACLSALEGGFVIDPQHPLARQSPSGRCFLVIDPNGIRLDVVADTIREINHRFPWLGILLLTGESLPDGATVSAWQLSNTVALQPALQDSAEYTARQMVRELTALVT